MSGERVVKIKFDGEASGAVRAGAQTRDALLGVDKQTDATSRSANKLDKAYGTASRSVIRDLDKMEQEAFRSGNGMDKAFTEAMTSMRAEVARLAIEGKQTGATLDSELGGSLLKVRQQADQLGESLRKGIKGGSGGEGGGVFDDLLGEIPTGKAGFLAAGAAIGGALFSGLKAEWAEDKVGGLLAAQQGAAASQAERLGDIAGNTFAGSFTDSIESVSEAMGALFDSGLIKTDAPEAAIDRLTDKVLTLEQTTGATANEIAIDVEQMLVTGLAESASQAMDILQRAAEIGLNRFGDLNDTVQEYSTSWREVGLNGQEALGLIKQSTDAGARNTDLAADAIKEFGIRAQDASATTSRGFTTLGLDAEKMGQAVARGGQPAKQALGEVLDKLNEMPPSVERNQAAVDLFGSKAEDLGDALFAMDLDDAASKFGKFAGSVEQAAAKLRDSQSFWDKFGKGVDNAANDLGEFLDTASRSDELDTMSQKVNELKLAQGQFLDSGSTKGFDEIKQKYPELADALDKYIEKNRENIDVQNEEKTATEENLETLDKMIQKRHETADATMGLGKANLDWLESIDAAAASLEKNGATLDGNTEKGRDNTKALYGMAESALSVADGMSGAGKSVSEVNGFLTTAQDQFIQTATKMGLPIGQAQQLARDLGLIPKTVFTKVELAAQNATDAAARYKAMIESIPPERFTVLRTIVGTGVGNGGGHAIIGDRWTGGPVQAGKSYLVGERGPEVLVMPNSSGGTVVPNHAVGAGPSVDVSVFLDGKALDARVDTKIRENNRNIKRAAGSGSR